MKKRWKSKLTNEFKEEISFEYIDQLSEPELFLVMFERNFVIHSGKWSNDSLEIQKNTDRLYEVRSTAGYSMARTLEVSRKPFELNSNFVYIVLPSVARDHPVYIWNGIYSSTDDSKVARTLLKNSYLVNLW